MWVGICFDGGNALAWVPGARCVTAAGGEGFVTTSVGRFIVEIG